MIIIQAHQQGRRADALEAKNKFQTAISCHQRASGRVPVELPLTAIFP